MNCIVEFDVGKIESESDMIAWLEQIGVDTWEPYTVGYRLCGVIFSTEQDALAFKIRFGL